MSHGSAWLSRQKKFELSELASQVGLPNFESLKKAELEAELDDFLSKHASKFASHPKAAPFYLSTRSRPAVVSPVKRETDAVKTPRRRAKSDAKSDETSTDESPARPPHNPRTPIRSVSVTRRIPLPTTPADVANAAARGQLVVRQRVASLYRHVGAAKSVGTVTDAARDVQAHFSTVSGVVAAVTAVELFFLRPEVLPNRYAFTLPAVPAVGLAERPVHVPDMFMLVTSSFWKPTLLWVAISLVAPAIAGFFFNLSAAASGQAAGSGAAARGRAGLRSAGAHGASDVAVDPLSFSVAKALLAFLVYAQGVTFGGLVDELSAARIEASVYGGWQGVLVGSAVMALMSVYDAVLKK